ncbi:MAG TPA: replicative DNA helicase [Clostridiales bacterium]|nr:replicative DNA helicase [Clostridiales bacterium]
MNDRPTDLLDQALPYSLEAEQSVLGAVLVDASCLSVVLDNLRPSNFYREEHQKIFEIMLHLFTTAQPVDFVTVLEQVCRENVFPSEADAKVYLTQLVEIVPSTRNVEAYANIVREKSYLRSLISAAHEIIENSRDSGESAQTILDSAEQRIFEIRADRHSSKLLPIGDVLLDIYDRLQKLSGEDREQYLGIPTGFGMLDRVITGLNKSDLILLAARPAMGKTSFALNIATNVAMKAKKTVAIFSLEMSREQLVERILASDALVQGTRMRTGELSPEEWVRLAISSKELAKAPILIDDTASLTVPEMKARLRRVKDLGLVIIDYLQLMSGGGRNENRVQVVSEITRSLKVMAKELNVPVIVLSQLSRQTESRADHRPMLSDLRESGSIEQDADLVLFLYREAYYNRDSGEQNIAECIVAKNRHGETGTVKLGWDGEHTKFSGLEMYRDEN